MLAELFKRRRGNIRFQFVNLVLIYRQMDFGCEVDIVCPSLDNSASMNLMCSKTIISAVTQLPDLLPFPGTISPDLLPIRRHCFKSVCSSANMADTEFTVSSYCLFAVLIISFWLVGRLKQQSTLFFHWNLDLIEPASSDRICLWPDHRDNCYC